MGVKTAFPAWFLALEAARKAAKRGDLTCYTLAEVLGASTDLAAAWLTKLFRWGYVSREGKTLPGDGRRVTRWAVTKWGRRYKPGANMGRSLADRRARPGPR